MYQKSKEYLNESLKKIIGNKKVQTAKGVCLPSTSSIAYIMHDMNLSQEQANKKINCSL